MEMCTLLKNVTQINHTKIFAQIPQMKCNRFFLKIISLFSCAIFSYLFWIFKRQWEIFNNFIFVALYEYILDALTSSLQVLFPHGIHDYRNTNFTNISTHHWNFAYAQTFYAILIVLPQPSCWQLCNWLIVVRLSTPISIKRNVTYHTQLCRITDVTYHT